MRKYLPVLFLSSSLPLITFNSVAADGKAIYEASCKMCHQPGMMGAPKLGDKAAWKARMSGGIALLEEHAIKGFKGSAGMMPPKGGNAKLSDDEVKAAVAYMVDSAK